MSHRPWLALLVLITLGAITAACATQAPSAAGTEPAVVVEAFYGWYLDAAGFDPETQERHNPLVEGTYRDRPELSAAFVARLDEMVADPQGLPADPLLCAQDAPESVTVGEVTIDGEQATVPVTTSFAGHGFTVTLQQSGDAWQIDDVTCTAP